jgi:hypothetical protein
MFSDTNQTITSLKESGDNTEILECYYSAAWNAWNRGHFTTNRPYDPPISGDHLRAKNLLDMIPTCRELYPETADQLQKIFTQATEHIQKAKEAGMNTKKIETYLMVAKNFWKDCDHTMAQTYLEGILETEIPVTTLLPILSLILLPTLLHRILVAPCS